MDEGSRLPEVKPALQEQLDLLTISDICGCYDRRLLEAAIRRRCHTIAVDPHTILCRILGRYKFYVDCRDQGLAPHLMLDGFWEYWVTDFICRNVKPGSVVFDVGANLGYYSVLMAELVGPTGRLLAFEPNPRLHQLLNQNLAINGFSGRSEAISRAVTDLSGERLVFRATRSDPKNGALVDRELSGEEDADVSHFAVSTVALDDYAKLPVDFIKVDVEGAEASLWRGMQALIAHNPKVQVLLEFNPGRCDDPERVLDEMASLFRLRQLDYDAIVRDCDRAQVLAITEDTMLYLSRGEPLDFSTAI